jgi:hypothetical protein
MSAPRPDLASDWPYVRHGAVTLFKDRGVLADAVALMRAEGYSDHHIDCCTDGSLIASLAAALEWQRHFGYVPDRLNLDALNDALASVPNAEMPRVVLVLERFEDFWQRDREVAIAVLDIIEDQSRLHLLFDNRLVAFVRTSDPALHVENLGGRAAQWNPKEWPMTSRGA